MWKCLFLNLLALYHPNAGTDLKTFCFRHPLTNDIIYSLQKLHIEKLHLPLLKDTSDDYPVRLIIKKKSKKPLAKYIDKTAKSTGENRKRSAYTCFLWYDKESLAGTQPIAYNSTLAQWAICLFYVVCPRPGSSYGTKHP